MNPLANWALSRGPFAAIVFKAFLVGPAVALLWQLRRRRVAEAAAWIVGVACLALTLCWCDYHRQRVPHACITQRVVGNGSSAGDVTIVYTFAVGRY